MEHHFNIEIAKDYGIEEAIMLNHFYFWIAKNASNNNNFIDGAYWTYNSKKAYSALFPYMNETKITRVITHLTNEGIIMKNNHNKDKFDRTNWYAFTEKGLEYLKGKKYDIKPFSAMLQNDTNDCVKMNNGAGQNEQPIPYIVPDNDNSIKKEKDKSFSQKDELFEKCWIAYRRKGKKGKSLPYWKKLTESEKQMVLPHIKAYVTSRELQYQQDFERYLRDKTFKTVVVAGNEVVYDPSHKTDNEYHPQETLGFLWHEQKRCFLAVGYDEKFIPDGYNDADRPDGATVVLNNARGTLVWSKGQKRWINITKEQERR